MASSGWPLPKGCLVHRRQALVETRCARWPPRLQSEPGSSRRRWLGLARVPDRGGARYRPKKVIVPASPVIAASTAIGRTTIGTGIPRLDTGQRVTFTFSVVDFATAVAKRQFRWQLFQGARNEQQLDAHWAPAGTATQLEKTFREPGEWTLAVQFIDRDLNYSKPTLTVLRIVRPWHEDARVMLPAGFGVCGLLGWAFVARRLYGRKRREAERLREQLLDRGDAGPRRPGSQEHGTPASPRSRGPGEQGQERLPREHEPRTAHAAQRHHRLQRDDPGGSARTSGQKALVPDLQKIHGAGKHLLGLINDILDLSKIEAGKMTLFLEEFDVAKLVEEVAATVQPLVAKNGNRLVVECPPTSARCTPTRPKCGRRCSTCSATPASSRSAGRSRSKWSENQ